MPRRFNILGPCQPALHYMLPVTRRLARVQRLIDRGSCFVVHAPENLGKTTTFANLARELTAEGRYAAVLLSMAVAATAHEDIGAAELAILGAWREDAASHLPPELRPPPWQDAPTGARIGDALTTWARACPRPLALFFDDFDALTGPPLISLLCQLRDGFPRRPEAFPWSLALVGLHDVRAYKADPDGGRDGSRFAFNIKERSLLLRNFTADEVVELYGQHTDETGQVFTPEASARAFALTQGQPWLVNALAKEAVEELVSDPAEAITAGTIDAAREALIRRQDVRPDRLALDSPRSSGSTVGHS